MNQSTNQVRFKAFLKLVRLPNVFTAPADSLAGWIIAGSGLVDITRWWPLPLASACVYAGGMALNDLCDLELDRVERPDRPLPAGEMTKGQARFLVLTLFGLALLLVGFTQSVRSFLVLCCLIGSVVAYDVRLRRTAVGPISMGTCRALNLALGLSVASELGGPVAWLAAASFGLFVTGLTYISLTEVEGGRNQTLPIGRWLQRLALLGYLLVVLGLPHPGGSHYPPIAYWIVPTLILTLTLLINEKAGARAWLEASPSSIQNAVRTAVFSLIWLDTALAAGTGSLWALVVAACWVPARLAGRWLYST